MNTTPHQILFGYQIEKNGMDGTCSAYGGKERGGVYRVLVGKSEGKRPLGRSKRRWEYYIEINFQEVGCEVM
jgi:hypothetical protein